MTGMSGSATREAVSERGSVWWLLLIVLIGFAIRMIFASGLSGDDDITVANSAIKLLEEGMQVPSGHYFARFGLTIPLAAVFGVAGVGVIQLDILPMVASLMGIMLAWRLGTLLFEPAVGLAAAAALALFPMDVEFASLFFPDVIQGTLMSAALLCALLAKTRGTIWAALAGIFWAWAYYVKVDAGFFVLVLALAAALRFISFRHLVVMGLVALALVGIELASYGFATGHPLLRLNLEHVAANEALAPGHDYRNLLTYPRSMFLVPYESGMHYYVLLAALILFLIRRERPAGLLVGWVLIWLAWLTFGADPFGEALKSKPQLPRYLLSLEMPVTILAGWFAVWLWRRSRPLGVLMGLGAVALVGFFAPINRLAFEPGNATRAGLALASRNGWFPLYSDSQSENILRFLTRGHPEQNQLRTVQSHDYRTGKTVFHPVTGVPAFLLVNQDFARRLSERSMVRPIDPASFGLRVTKVGQIDNPLPAADYAAMRLLSRFAAVLPGSLRDHIRHSTADIVRPADVIIYRLDRSRADQPGYRASMKYSPSGGAL